MYCTGCGVQIGAEDNFCPSCGHESRLGETRRQTAPGYSTPKHLYRSLRDKKIAGVCSGLARYLDTDVTVVRLAVFAGVVLSGGIGLLVYIAAWIIMPVEPSSMAQASPAHDTSHAPA